MLMKAIGALMAIVAAAHFGVDKRGTEAVQGRSDCQCSDRPPFVMFETPRPGVRDLARFATMLRDTSVRVRLVAAQELGRLTDSSSVEPLVTVLADTSCEVAAAAAWSLRYADARAAAPLRHAVLHGRCLLRERAADVLENFPGTESAQVALQALGDPSARVRAGAARALGVYGTRQAVAPLMVALRDASAHVRAAAAQSLGRLGDARALAPLTRALEDSEKSVRQMATEAIGRIGEAREPLLPQKSTGGLLARGERACEWEGWLPPAAGRARYRAEYPMTRAQEADLRRRLTSPSSKVRDAAARALAAGTDSATVSALLGMLGDSSEHVREGATRSLGRIGSPRAVPALEVALRDARKSQRQAAAWSLGQIRHRSSASTTALLEATRDSSEHVRAEAAWSLGMLGDTAAFSRLRAMAADPHKSTRLAAVCAIGWLGGVTDERLARDTSEAVRGAAAWARARRRD